MAGDELHEGDARPGWLPSDGTLYSVGLLLAAMSVWALLGSQPEAVEAVKVRVRRLSISASESLGRMMETTKAGARRVSTAFGSLDVRGATRRASHYVDEKASAFKQSVAPRTEAGRAWCERMLPGRQQVFIIVLIFCAMLVYYEDVKYGDVPMGTWVLLGAIGGGAGGCCGVGSAIALHMVDPTAHRVAVSRHGCGSFDYTCCFECTKDAALALMALGLSLLTAAALGTSLVGLVGLLLSVLHHLELDQHWEAAAEETFVSEPVLLSLAVLAVFVWSWVRHHAKSKLGWWRGGEAIADGEFSSADWKALL